MRYKGALHVHSTLSHDGTLTIPELARWYSEKGYQFIAMGEHSQDLNEEKIHILRDQCAASSGNSFCVIPGVEFSCSGGIHIFGLGAVGLTRDVDPLVVAAEIHALNGFAILAHPKRIGWMCAPELLLVIDAIEIWNVAYDGKYLPSSLAPERFLKMQKVNPKLRAIAGHDLHRKPAFYDVSIEVDVAELAPGPVLEAISSGRYSIRSRFFRTDSGADQSWAKSVWFRLLSRQLAVLRKARDIFWR